MIPPLSDLYHWFGSGPGAASILVALIALIGAVSGVVTSYFVAGRSVYINSITAERSKWIEKLRVNIAAYSSTLARVSFSLFQFSKNKGSADAVRSRLEELNEVVSVIQLQLNPWGEIDRNILRILEGVVLGADVNYKLVERADRLLIAHSQWLLKAEWEKVKYEARGPLYRLWHRGDENRRLSDYLTWAENRGSLTELLDDFSRERVRLETVGY